MSKQQFDPWDWLGISCGGFFRNVDDYILAFLEEFSEDPDDAIERRQNSNLFDLVATFLCNTDAFEVNGDPRNLRFVGDEQFKTIDALIEAWEEWYGRNYR